MKKPGVAGLFIWASGCEDRWGDGIAAHPPRVLAHVGTGEGAAIRFVAEGRVRWANRKPVPGALRAIEQAACQPSTGGPARQLRGTGLRHERIFAEGPSAGRGFPPSLPFRQLIPSQFGNARDTAGM